MECGKLILAVRILVAHNPSKAGCRESSGKSYNGSLKESPAWTINHLFAENHEYPVSTVSLFYYTGVRAAPITEYTTSVK